MGSKQCKTYYKITNEKENHNGFQYQDGLNILQKEFDDDPKHFYGHGLYFMDIQNIFPYFSYGIYLREVTLPVSDPNFKMIKVENKYRANMIIFGKRHELYNVDTIKMLIDRGMKIHPFIDVALTWSAGFGYLEIVKYLVELGANIHENDDKALTISAEKGHLDIIKYFTISK